MTSADRLTPGGLVAVLFLVFLAAGCRTQDLAFREDRRVTITSPQNLSRVKLPVSLRWKVKDFTIVMPDGTSSKTRGHFGIFIDRAPPPPGERLVYFFRHDPICRPISVCLSEQYLSAHGIYQTTERAFVIETIGKRLDVSKGQEDVHEIVVTLLDGTGRRIGESGDSVGFRLIRNF